VSEGLHTRRRAELRSFTTLHTGGPARLLVEVADVARLPDALALARAEGGPLLVLGGGSNLLVADAGFDGTVLRILDASMVTETDGDRVRLRAGAGLGWDVLVAASVERGLTGLECLSGIPGSVGAAPIQNVGAYGQEVAERIGSVQVTDHRDGSRRWIAGRECGFGYRDSRFKGEWRDRFVVTAVEFLLERGGEPVLRYPELVERAARLEGAVDAAAVRELVLAIRRSKSMVLDPADPDTRSAGSFFTNPIIHPGLLEGVHAGLRALGLDPGAMPGWPQPDGRIKLSAAWLIERAGFHRGDRHGGAAISKSHVLALVNRGGGADHLVALAGRIRRDVRDRFGIVLVPEPVFVGFDSSVDELLG
jgi:UDP-N-acetylmuramate dehydrogenase